MNRKENYFFQAATMPHFPQFGGSLEVPQGYHCKIQCWTFKKINKMHALSLINRLISVLIKKWCIWKLGLFRFHGKMWGVMEHALWYHTADTAGFIIYLYLTFANIKGQDLPHDIRMSILLFFLEISPQLQAAPLSDQPQPQPLSCPPVTWDTNCPPLLCAYIVYKPFVALI